MLTHAIFRGIGESGHFPKEKLTTTYSPEEEENRKQEKLRKAQALEKKLPEPE